MLVIGRPEVLVENRRALLRASITCEDYPEDRLWLSTSPDYAEYLCADRADGFLAAVLPYAMLRHHDIRVDAPVSERLYYTITEYLLPALHNAIPGLHEVDVECDLEQTSVPNAGAVGTGISCGVDSLFTVARHTGGKCPPDYRLTHLTFHDVGSHGTTGTKAARLAHDRQTLAREFASETGLPLVAIDTNWRNIITACGVDYEQIHTYLNAGCILAVQKLFHAYYYSSGYPVYAFDLTIDYSARYDSYSLPLLSTDQLGIFPSGAPYSRVEKTRYLVDYEPSHRYLNVCVTAGRNCSRCTKCLRTLLTLDILGALEAYRGVFDLDLYERHRQRYVVQVMHGHDEFSREIRVLMDQTGYTIPRQTYAYHSLRQRLAALPAARKVHSALRNLRGRSDSPNSPRDASEELRRR